MIPLIIYAHCGPSWKWNNRPHKRGFLTSYACGSIHYAIQNSSLVVYFTAYTRGLPTSPKIVVKQGVIGGQATGPCRPNQGLKMLTEKSSFLPIETRRCAVLLQPQLSPDEERNIWQHLVAHLPGNGGSARMSSALQVQTAPWLRFQ
jgi:hypothetical protein